MIGCPAQLYLRQSLFSFLRRRVSLAHLASNGNSCGGQAAANHLASFAPPVPQHLGRGGRPETRLVVLVRASNAIPVSAVKANGELNAPYRRTMKGWRCRLVSGLGDPVVGSQAGWHPSCGWTALEAQSVSLPCLLQEACRKGTVI